MSSLSEVVKISIDEDEETLQKKLNWAAGILREGGVVAIPTETVYGLAADAYNEAAVERIYELKNRPYKRPLPLVTTKERAHQYIKQVPEWVKPLVDSFWPGPLSLIFWKSVQVPDVLTAGSPKVAVRVPSHPITLKLLKMTEFPLAVPSANISGRPSPRRARHVIEDLDGLVDGILDAGPTSGGVESTMVDVTRVPPVVVRPGAITVEELQDRMGENRLEVANKKNGNSRHYKPRRAVVYVVECADEPRLAAKFAQLIGFYQGQGNSVGVGASSPVLRLINKDEVGQFAAFDLGSDLPTITARVFDALRWGDANELDVLLMQGFCGGGLARTIMNRLTQAAEGRVVRV